MDDHNNNEEDEGRINSVRMAPNDSQLPSSGNSHNRSVSIYANYFNNTELEEQLIEDDFKGYNNYFQD